MAHNDPDLLTYDQQIVPMILYKMKISLTSSLVDGLTEDDPIRSLSVDIGRFRENPLSLNIHVAIAGGNTIDPDYIDGRIDNDQLDDIKVRNLPVGEIGGGTYWWRRGCIDYGCYFVKQPMEYQESMIYAYAFYGRLLEVMDHLQIGGLVDIYREQTSGTPYIESSTFYESGGAKKHIWRGKLFWRVLTWRP
jgi:hypothetical protein